MGQPPLCAEGWRNVRFFRSDIPDGPPLKRREGYRAARRYQGSVRLRRSVRFRHVPSLRLQGDRPCGFLPSHSRQEPPECRDQTGRNPGYPSMQDRPEIRKTERA